MRKYVFENQSIKLVIEEDIEGCYLYIYEEPKAFRPSQDYFLISLENAFKKAQKKYGITKDQWIGS
ncbi:MAG: hypothetical protein JSR58_03990 [Verrucomicrobia bacterium]|nr:hypothetical protein [Verrucomicrobiota bacterium]